MRASDFLGTQRKALEESFFKDLERKQIEQLRKEHERKSRLDALRTATGVEDTHCLETLAALEFSPEAVTALSLTPLVFVAWADGELNEREREAILRAAEPQGVAGGSASHELLQRWFAKRPSKNLAAAWRGYLSALVKKIPPADLAALRSATVDRARAVAESAGGFLGLGSKVSDAERRVLTEIDRAVG